MDIKKVGVVTLGCRVNQYETQACIEVFEKYGFEAAEIDDICDAFFINTCSVTAESDRKSKQVINRAIAKAQRNNGPVIVCGCHIQAHPDDSPFPSNVHLCGNTNKAEFVKTVLESSTSQRLIPDIAEMTDYFETPVSGSKNTRAFIKIEDGCDNFCSYCIVPYLRGPVRSRPVKDVYDEVVRVTENGFKEVVLTGIETSFYGTDLQPKTDLCELSELISEIPALERIRFGSLRPTLFTKEFSQRLSAVKKVMNHFHLSLQSGSDKVLTMMKRNYTKRDILSVFENIRSNFPNATMSADIICGFPGETEADFTETVDIVSRGRLLKAHIFPFSERPGTEAGEMRFQLPHKIRRERCSRLLSRSDELTADVIADFSQMTFNVLVEKSMGTTSWGYTDNFIYTKFRSFEEVPVGQIKKVRLTGETERKRNALIALGAEVF